MSTPSVHAATYGFDLWPFQARSLWKRVWLGSWEAELDYSRRSSAAGPVNQHDWKRRREWERTGVRNGGEIGRGPVRETEKGMGEDRCEKRRREWERQTWERNTETRIMTQARKQNSRGKTNDNKQVDELRWTYEDRHTRLHTYHMRCSLVRK